MAKKMGGKKVSVPTKKSPGIKPKGKDKIDSLPGDEHYVGMKGNKVPKKGGKGSQMAVKAAKMPKRKK